MKVNSLGSNLFNIQPSYNKSNFIRVDRTLKADTVSFTGSITAYDKMSAYAVRLLEESKLKEDQPVLLEADSKYLPFMRVVAQEAYKRGSGYVKIKAKEPELEKLKQKYNITEDFDYKKKEAQEFSNALKLSFDENNDPYKMAGMNDKEVETELKKIYPPVPKLIQRQFKMKPQEIFKTAMDIHEGQPVSIHGEREHLPMIVKLVDYLYSKNKTRLVDVSFGDESIVYDRNLLQYGKDNLLEKVPQSVVDADKEFYEKDVARLFLDGEDPSSMQVVDSKRIVKRSLAFSEARKKYRTLEQVNNPWLVYYAPTICSSMAVYKEARGPLDALSMAYKDANKINRVGGLDKHVKTLKARAEKMNNLMEQGYRTLHYVSVDPQTKKPNGRTDFRVTMSPSSIFKAAREDMPKFNHKPIVNIPTEEVFTAPMANTAEGHIAATMPLVLNGKVVDGIILNFKDGKVFDVYASQNADMLKEHIKSHANADRLGEVALVADSPIAKTGRLFMNTLLDENAACHLALGDAYADCVKGATEIEDFDKQQKFLKDLHINSSTTHNDFMVGGPNVYIYAENKETGQSIPIIQDDKFLI